MSESGSAASGAPVEGLSDPFSTAWRSEDGHYGGMVRLVPPDTPYPAMVKLELYDPAGSVDLTMTAADTWALIARLLAAANGADGLIGKLLGTTPTARLRGESF